MCRASRVRGKHREADGRLGYIMLVVLGCGEEECTRDGGKASDSKPRLNSTRIK
jgi:hypothetical protein